MTKEMTTDECKNATKYINIIKPLFKTPLRYLLLKNIEYRAKTFENCINQYINEFPDIKNFYTCEYEDNTLIAPNIVSDFLSIFFTETISSSQKAILKHIKYNFDEIKVSVLMNENIDNNIKYNYSINGRKYIVIITPIFMFHNIFINEHDSTIIPFLSNFTELIEELQHYNTKKQYMTFVYNVEICYDDIIDKPKKDKYKNKKLKKKMKKNEIKQDDIINDSSDDEIKQDDIINDSYEDEIKQDDIINDSYEEIKQDEIKQDDIINDSSDDEIIKDNNHKEEKIIFNYYIEDKDKITNMINNLMSINDNFNNNFNDMKLKIKKGLHYDNFKRLHFTAYFFNETTKKPTYHFYIKDDIIINITVINNIL